MYPYYGRRDFPPVSSNYDCFQWCSQVPDYLIGFEVDRALPNVMACYCLLSGVDHPTDVADYSPPADMYNLTDPGFGTIQNSDHTSDNYYCYVRMYSGLREISMKSFQILSHSPYSSGYSYYYC